MQKFLYKQKKKTVFIFLVYKKMINKAMINFLNKDCLKKKYLQLF